MSVIRDLLDSTKLLLNDSLATTGSNIFVGTQTLTGSIDLTGTIDGIDLQAFSSSVAAGFANTTADYNELTNIPAGIVSSSSQIASDISGSFTSISASIASDIAGISTDWESITSKPAGILSGSSQITITESQISDLTHYTDSDVKTKLNSEGVISGSLPSKLNNTSVDFGTGTVTATTLTGAVTASGIQAGGHILPDTTEIYDLGSSDKRFRDLYLSGSTIDLGGTKISRDSTTGDIEFFDGANNRKSLKVDELTIGSGANARKIKVDNGKVAFTDVSNARQDTETSHILPNIDSTYDIGSTTAKYRHLNLSGDITVGGTVDGINLQAFSSSVATDLANPTADYTQLTNIPAGIVSSSSQITITESQISDLVKYTDSDTLSYINSVGVVSGSVASDWNSITDKPAGLISGSETLHSQTFTSTALVNVSHGFETKDVIVYVYDNNDNLIWPTGIKTTTANAVDITFNAPRSGRVVVSKGGHFVTGIGETSYVSGSNVIGAVDEVKNNNLSSGSLSFWQGTQAEYDALPSYGDTTIYFVI